MRSSKEMSDQQAEETAERLCEQIYTLDPLSARSNASAQATQRRRLAFRSAALHHFPYFFSSFSFCHSLFPLTHFSTLFLAKKISFGHIFARYSYIFFLLICSMLQSGSYINFLRPFCLLISTSAPILRTF